MKPTTALIEEIHCESGRPVAAYAQIPHIERIRLHGRELRKQAERAHKALFELLPAEDAEFTRLERIAEALALLLYATHSASLEFGINLDSVLPSVLIEADDVPTVREVLGLIQENAHHE